MTPSAGACGRLAAHGASGLAWLVVAGPTGLVLQGAGSYSFSVREGRRWPLAASGWAAQVTRPRALILVASALVLVNIPLTRYGSSNQPEYFWSSLAVLLAAWQLWDHQRLAWVVLTAATAVALPLYALSAAGVINYLQPGRWMVATGAANILALAIFVSPPIRRWVAIRPGPRSHRDERQ